jgi:hypothetical protein
MNGNKNIEFPSAEMALYKSLLEQAEGKCADPEARPFLKAFAHELAAAMRTMSFSASISLPQGIDIEMKNEVQAKIHGILNQYKEQVVKDTIAPLIFRVLQAEGKLGS